WAIAQRIQQVSGELQIVQGSLYPSLHRLEEQGWLDSEWRTADSNRQAKFYRLTPRGRRQLAEETRNWERFTIAVGRVLSEA
ncbi:MAG TPA: PadR family transcriptional regulator, partial [Vicinamibacterales bacterium]|nr:PadR family transcriptional regulator [Vicinamibacterales bacterium]